MPQPVVIADYLAKVEEKKERLKDERARQREEEKAMREFEAEKRRLEKEQAHYQSALEKLREKGDEQEVSEMEAKLAEIEAAIKGVENREANNFAGYVWPSDASGPRGCRNESGCNTVKHEIQDRSTSTSS